MKKLLIIFCLLNGYVQCAEIDDDDFDFGNVKVHCACDDKQVGQDNDDENLCENWFQFANIPPPPDDLPFPLEN